MTKLYCPKGHEIAEPTLESLKEITVKFKDSHNRRCTQWLLYCDICYRPYLGCDLLADDTNVVTKNSNSAEFDGIKTEAQLCDHDRQGGRDEIDGNLCLTCEKCNAIEAIQIEAIPFKREKTESQIAVDRVVEALVKVRCADDVDAVCNSTLLDGVIFELEELNK